MNNYILAFESSCDDTAVAILDTNYRVIVSLISSQPEHLEFGGVLPELASRLHIKNIMHLTKLALIKSGLTLNDISAIAVSINPGLIGSLIVGLSFAKSLAWALSKPLITVNHLLSHIFANFIDHPQVKAPFLALVVSGGHTELVHFDTLTDFEVIGKTVDDAAGETFAIDGNPKFHRFPRALPAKDNYNFSYSGVKTAIRTYLEKHDPAYIKAHQADIAASIQAAIIDPLITKSLRKARELKLHTLLLAGGVAANSALRARLTAEAEKHGIKVYYPSLGLCMDNAAMVAAAAIPKFKQGLFAPLSVNAFSQKGTRVI